jgi:uncharacterized membrane protein
MNFISIGLLLIIAGIIIMVIGSIVQPKNSEVKYSVVGFLGFIPFGFSNDRKLLIFSIIITVILLAFVLFSVKNKLF